MEHFVRIVMEKQESINRLDESVFPHQEIYETEQNATVIEIPLARLLSESESDEYAERLANLMFESGYSDFDIEISTDDDKFIEEITLDGDDFFEEFGIMWYNEDEALDEAEYQDRKVTLGKPMRSKNGPKKFHVYVKDPSTKNIKKVNFGDPDMKIKRSSPERKRNFRARHNCDNPGPRTKARFWSCKKW
jgi:hypothetical protein